MNRSTKTFLLNLLSIPFLPFVALYLCFTPTGEYEDPALRAAARALTAAVVIASFGGLEVVLPVLGLIGILMLGAWLCSLD